MLAFMHICLHIRVYASICAYMCAYIYREWLEMGAPPWFEQKDLTIHSVALPRSEKDDQIEGYSVLVCILFLFKQ